MGAISAMNDTFRFFQKRYKDIALPAVEGYLIMMVMQFAMMPIMFIFLFPTVFIPVLSPEGLTIFFIIFFIVFYALSLAITSIGMGIIQGGTVRAIDAVRNYEKVKFGDVFKYGWKNKWELFTIQFLNSLLVTVIIYGGLGILIGIGILMINFSPLAGIMFMIISMIVFMFLVYFLIAVNYLPFIVRHKRGTRGAENIILGWKEYFSDFGTYGVMGFLIGLIIIVLSMIPLVSIIVALALHSFIISSLLIHYDKKYMIPVNPPPLEPPPFQQYPMYRDYPHYQGYQNQPGPQYDPKYQNQPGAQGQQSYPGYRQY